MTNLMENSDLFSESICLFVSLNKIVQKRQQIFWKQAFWDKSFLKITVVMFLNCWIKLLKFKINLWLVILW